MHFDVLCVKKWEISITVEEANLKKMISYAQQRRPWIPTKHHHRLAHRSCCQHSNSNILTDNHLVHHRLANMDSSRLVPYHHYAHIPVILVQVILVQSIVLW